MSSDVYSVISAQFLPNPGICRTCGSNQRDCVDFGITFDYEGAVLICVSCIQELVKIPELGFVHKDQVEAVYRDNADLMLQTAAIDITRQELRNGLVAVLNTYDTSITSAIANSAPVLETASEKPEKLF